jgi:MerR family transcriptional regulator, light-induced transcriptional regulator
MSRSEPVLSIGELAERTGLAVPTLRMWEDRHGFPRPHRLPSGHRRYSARDGELVAQVVRERAAGLSLGAAIARVQRTADHQEPSIFAGLGQQWPALAPHRLSKHAMLAISRAIEDECCARSGPAVLIGAFQRERFYRRSERRWVELARTADGALVFADFPRRRSPRGRPVELPIPPSASLRREWAVICDAPRSAACLTGWELPGQASTPDARRAFEARWTTHPEMVRSATRLALDLAAEQSPQAAAECAAVLDDVPTHQADEPERTVALTNRIVAHLDALSHRPRRR